MHGANAESSSQAAPTSSPPLIDIQHENVYTLHDQGMPAACARKGNRIDSLVRSTKGFTPPLEQVLSTSPTGSPLSSLPRWPGKAMKFVAAKFCRTSRRSKPIPRPTEPRGGLWKVTGVRRRLCTASVAPPGVSRDRRHTDNAAALQPAN